ncbi:MAG: hypothetical protein K2Q34_04485 [Alphaproteobacteria bacterium]|nr:hypothetical protein [Alphaproteobacteria bacterium]
MKIFEKLIKTVLISAMVTGSSFSASDPLQDLKGLGFTSSTTLAFTQHTVNFLLAPSFDPTLEGNSAIRHAKILLRGTVIELISLTTVPSAEYNQTTAFLGALNTALTRAGGTIGVDITPLAYNLNFEPTAAQINTAAHLLFDRITALNTAAIAAVTADDLGVSMTGHVWG